MLFPLAFHQIDLTGQAYYILSINFLLILYRNAFITTPGVNIVRDFDLKYFYDYNTIYGI